MARWKYISGEDWGDQREGRTHIDVYCEDATPVKTGLLDTSGAPLWRIPDNQPIGFSLMAAKRKGRGGKKC